MYTAYAEMEGRGRRRSRQEVRVGFCRLSYQINVIYAHFPCNQHTSPLFENKHIHILIKNEFYFQTLAMAFY